MNSITHYTKKKQILARKERALQRLIEHGAETQKLIAVAADVRESRIRVLRARRAEIPPKADAAILYGKIETKIQSLLGTSPEQILAEFGFSCESTK